MAGYLVYVAMIVPQGTLYIYDPVANRNQAVGGIPDGIVFIAGTMNEIEQFMVNTIYTASDPMSYENMAGGRGFNLMYDMAQAGGVPVDADIAASLKQSRTTASCSNSRGRGPHSPSTGSRRAPISRRSSPSRRARPSIRWSTRGTRPPPARPRGPFSPQAHEPTHL